MSNKHYEKYKTTIEEVNEYMTHHFKTFNLRFFKHHDRVATVNQSTPKFTPYNSSDKCQSNLEPE